MFIIIRSSRQFADPRMITVMHFNSSYSHTPQYAWTCATLIHMCTRSLKFYWWPSACSGGRIVSWIIYCWLVWCERKTLFPAENLRSFTSKRTGCVSCTSIYFRIRLSMMPKYVALTHIVRNWMKDHTNKMSLILYITSKRVARWCECTCRVVTWFCRANYNKLFPLFLNKLISKICASQTFVSLTNFIKKSNNIYDIKWVYYENILYGISNYTNLMSQILKRFSRISVKV